MLKVWKWIKREEKKTFCKRDFFYAYFQLTNRTFYTYTRNTCLNIIEYYTQLTMDADPLTLNLFPVPIIHYLAVRS